VSGAPRRRTPVSLRGAALHHHDLDPEEIHELGLQEVARFEAEQAGICERLGFTDLHACRSALASDPALYATSRQLLLDRMRSTSIRCRSSFPSCSACCRPSRWRCGRWRNYREKEAAAAEYHPGTPDGSRPGIVYVNTGDYEKRSLVGIEAVAITRAARASHADVDSPTPAGVAPFRRHGYFGAYIEDWALYSERLGKDVGFYEDPHSDFGRVSNELLRAVRLVLDTGVHHKRWSREQMVDYFQAHSTEDEPDLQAEVDRYIVLPGQALSYKLGELEITRLRERARATLGPRFDIRAFHDKLLDGGALPLDVLAERIGSWMEGYR